ncbi:MAG: M1 family metallopeptidase [Candidatus Onthoplasma sp.]
MKKFLCLILVLFVVFSCASCKKKDNLIDLGKDKTNYEISINVDDSDMSVLANETVTYINDTNQVIKNIKFHLYPQFFEQGKTDCIVPSTKLNSAFPYGMSYSNFEVCRVIENEHEQTVLYEGENDDILSVPLTNSLLPNDKAIIQIEFMFSIPNCAHRLGYVENTINLANFYPIVCVFENGEFNTSPYNANGDPFYSNMANYQVSVTANKDFVLATSGKQEDETISGDKSTTTFSAYMVRDFAIVLSKDFQVKTTTINDTAISYFYFDDECADASLKAGVDSLSTFSNLFGSYPYPTFNIVQTNFVHGGMEYPGLIMISASIEDQNDYMNVIVHETAHQWWYGMVGNDEYNYPWLDEALTEYSTILFYDFNSGYEFNHAQMVQSCKDNYSLFINVYQDVLGTIDTSMRSVNAYSTEPEYTYCIYVKGVLMFDSIYNLIGKDKFLKCLKTYFEENKYKNVTPDCLVSAFSRTTKQDFEPIFSSWIKGKVVIR